MPARGVPLEIGKGRVLREGSRVAILSFRHAAWREPSKAAEALGGTGGVGDGRADARFAKPLDEER